MSPQADSNFVYAYYEGYRMGKADRLLNWKSDYAWQGINLEPKETYTFEYSRGYRAGFESV